MTFIKSWEEFSKAVEKVYINDPLKCRFNMKYRNSDGVLILKMTDNNVCLQYKTEHNQDVKKLEKLIGQLLRHMASKEK